MDNNEKSNQEHSTYTNDKHTNDKKKNINQEKNNENDFSPFQLLPNPLDLLSKIGNLFTFS